MKRTTIVEIISILLILLFVYAAVSKLIDYQRFRVQLGQSPLLTAFADLVAWLVPTAEMMIALLLCLPRFRLYGLYASFSLMTMFTSYIFILTHYSDYVPCSCGGILENMNWNQHFIFNIAFMFLAMIAIPLETSIKDNIPIPI